MNRSLTKSSISGDSSSAKSSEFKRCLGRIGERRGRPGLEVLALEGVNFDLTLRKGLGLSKASMLATDWTSPSSTMGTLLLVILKEGTVLGRVRGGQGGERQPGRSGGRKLRSAPPLHLRPAQRER